MIKVSKAVTKADLSDCHWMQMTVFRDGEHREVSNDHWWIARVDGESAGFACLRIYTSDNSAYLALSGVLTQYRGQGIQKLLIRARENYGRKVGCKTAVTYTAWRNWASANSLIRMGYTLFAPKKPWGLDNSYYFRKAL